MMEHGFSNHSQGGVDNGKNDLSTEQNQKSQNPWFPFQDGNRKRP
jgi:hypothetical protein